MLVAVGASAADLSWLREGLVALRRLRWEYVCYIYIYIGTKEARVRTDRENKGIRKNVYICIQLFY